MLLCFGRALAAACLVLALAVPAASAAPGDLDASFGSGGGVADAAFTQGRANGTAITVAPDGKIVIAGRRERTIGSDVVQDWVAARFTADGQLDPSFNGNGRSQPVLTNFVTGPLAEGAEALAVLGDGSVLVAGQTEDRVAVGKLTPGGASDMAFGLNGVGSTPSFPGTTRADVTSLAVQPDGRVLAGGTLFAGGHLTAFLARFTATGDPDGTFATGGIAFVPDSACDKDVPATDCLAKGLAVQTTGLDVTAVYLGGGNEQGNLIGGRVWRFVPPSGPGEWAVDTSYGSADTPGGAQIPRDVVNEVDSLLLAPDGRVVATGLAQSGPSFQCGLARIAPSGALDGTGRVNLSGTCEPHGLATLADGRFVVSAYVSSGAFGAGDFQVGVARFTADGNADPSFAAGGGRTVDVAPSFGGGIAVQGDKLLLTGGRGDPHNAMVERVAGGDLTSGGEGGGGGGGAGGGTPTKLPHVSGVGQSGGRLSCDPGSLNGALDYTWFMVGGDGSSAAIGSGPLLTVPVRAEGFGVECFVHRAGDSAGYSSDNRVRIRPAVAPAVFPTFTKTLKNYLPGTLVCGPKRYCTDDEVRSDLEKQGFNMDWANVKIQTHRGKVPAALRDDLAPGAVIDVDASPISGKRITSGPGKVITFKATIFRPVLVPRTRCPFGADLLSIGDDDFQLDDLLKGQTFSEAKTTLKKYHCYKLDADGDETAVEYTADLHTSRTATTSKVTAAKVVPDRTYPHRRRIDLEVDIPLPRLVLDVRAEPSASSPTLGLGDQGLTAGPGVTSFAVHVSTTSGIDAKNIVVELRDGSGESVDFQRTDAQGTAHFRAPAPDPGTYELSALLTDHDGDAMSGFEPIKAVNRRGAAFTDMAGGHWAYNATKKQYTPTAAARSAAAFRAQLTAPEAAALAKLQQGALGMLSNLLKPLVQAGVSSCVATDRASQAFCDATAGDFLTRLMRGTQQQIATAAQAFTALLPALRGFALTGNLLLPNLDFGLSTLGGNGTLTIGQPTQVDMSALALDATQLRLQTRKALKPGAGALSLHVGALQVLADGSYIVAQGGGNIISNDGGSFSPLTLDDLTDNFDLQPLSRIVAQGAGNLIGDNGSGLSSVLITLPGARIISDNGGGLVGNSGGTLISDHGVGIVAQGGGNIISNDGASITGQGGANVLSDNGLG